MLIGDDGFTNFDAELSGVRGESGPVLDRTRPLLSFVRGRHSDLSLRYCPAWLAFSFLESHRCDHPKRLRAKRTVAHRYPVRMVLRSGYAARPLEHCHHESDRALVESRTRDHWDSLHAKRTPVRKCQGRMNNDSQQAVAWAALRASPVSTLRFV